MSRQYIFRYCYQCGVVFSPQLKTDGRDDVGEVVLCNVCYWRGRAERAEGDEGSIRADLRRAAATGCPELHLFGSSRCIINAFGHYSHYEYLTAMLYDEQVWLCLLVAEAL